MDDVDRIPDELLAARAWVDAASSLDYRDAIEGLRAAVRAAGDSVSVSRLADVVAGL